MCSGVPSSEKIMASLHFRGPDQTRHSLSRAAPVTAFGALLNLQRIWIGSKWSFSSSSELWPPWLSPFLSVSKSNSSSPCHKSKNWESVSPDETWYYKPVRANSHARDPAFKSISALSSFCAILGINGHFLVTVHWTPNTYMLHTTRTRGVLFAVKRA